jgi:hypothetical protein
MKDEGCNQLSLIFHLSSKDKITREILPWRYDFIAIYTPGPIVIASSIGATSCEWRRLPARQLAG